VIIIDTNVISEVLKPRPSDAVVRWLTAQEPTAVFTTAVTKAEVLYGVESLPRGKRQAQLSAAIESMLVEEYEGRILSFDEYAAREYARIVAEREVAGRPISQFDAMIAAITRLHDAVLATRNLADFDRCGIDLINPWDG